LFKDGPSRARSDAQPPSDVQAPNDGAGVRSDDSFADTVSKGVRLGYSVIEDQIRRGRQAAGQIGLRSAAGSGLGGDVGDIGQRLLSFSTDLGAFYMDLVDMAMRLPQRSDRRRDAEPSAGGTRSAEGEAAAIAIDIEATGRSRVTLDLREGTASSELRVPALYALEGGSAPLTAIRFERADGEPATLRIRVPEDQPPGTYTGVVVDGRTNEPKGTLSIKLAGAERQSTGSQ
jgi:hypothetical protein